MKTAASGGPGDDGLKPGDIYLVKFGSHFRSKADLGPAPNGPLTVYRETVTKAARGEGKFIRYSGGKGQHGHAVVRLEPNAKGKGIEIIDEIVGGTIPKEFIKPTIAGIKEACHNGTVAGHPVVDVIVKIVDGSYDEVHSSELAFKMAGIFAFKDAMKQAAPILFDPVTGRSVTEADIFAKVRPAVVVSFGDSNRKFELARKRFLSNPLLNRFALAASLQEVPVLCVPLTTRRLGSRYEVSLGQLEFMGQESWAYIEGVALFSREKLLRFLGRVSFAQFQEIEAALRLVEDL
jgi:mRNA-degrading endonuclease toxin of MazEF toxin-antitoxin module